MDKEKFKLLCTQYFFHTINDAELEELRTVLNSGDPAFLKIYFQIKNGIENLPVSVDLIEPPLDVKKSILKELKKGKQKKEYSSPNKYSVEVNKIKFKLITIAAVIFFIAFTAVTIYSAGLIRDIHNLESQSDLMNQNLKKKNAILSVLQSKQIDIINLIGQDINPSGYGKIIWSPSNNGAILQVGNLPPTMGKSKYNLWVDKNNVDVSEGSFTVRRPDYENFFKLDSLSFNSFTGNNSFFLTLEPNGKVNKPSGPIYLFGDANN